MEAHKSYEASLLQRRLLKDRRTCTGQDDIFKRNHCGIVIGKFTSGDAFISGTEGGSPAGSRLLPPNYCDL